jgi:hypothetical protein
MILLGNPYVSPLLAATAAVLQIPALKLGDVKLSSTAELNLQTEQNFFRTFAEKRLPLLTNSENSIEALERHVPDHPLVRQAALFKNKAKFRHWLREMYPDFCYRECHMEDLDQLSPGELPFPVIVKPAIGYASLGVYRVNDAEEWTATCSRIKQDMEEARLLYPASVLNASRYLIEEWIEGEEYAIDAYYDADGEPVILNVFKRMFSHQGDTSDRIYYTSKQVISEATEPVVGFLRDLGEKGDFRFFPLHVEVRISAAGRLVPIEVNPLRFAGIGTADLGYYAYGINPYESFFLQRKPDWQRILAESDEHIYSFFCAELPVSLNATKLVGIDEALFRTHFSDILAYRPMYGYDPTTFAVVFYRSDNLEENKRLLLLDLQQFVQINEPIHT